MTTSRQLVLNTLNFINFERAPRQLWTLPWADIYYPEQIKTIKATFPDDIVSAPPFYDTMPKTVGGMYEIGDFIDTWGCKFTNKLNGIIGETKEALIKDEDYEDIEAFRVPEEELTINKDKINEFCRNTDKFVMAGDFARPFEQMQFIRGTEQLYVDLILKPDGLFKVLGKMHEFYCRQLTVWAQTDVDGLVFIDDWGSQKNLLINPKIWTEIFKPMYKDYADIAHKYGKKIFMHSDGYILDIIPDLIEIGIDALNAQVFCMGVEKLALFKGKITFWGEIDRQNMLPYGTTQEIFDAVTLFKDNLWDNGGCVAQCEFGPGANPDNVFQVFNTWNSIFHSNPS